MTLPWPVQAVFAGAFAALAIAYALQPGNPLSIPMAFAFAVAAALWGVGAVRARALDDDYGGDA